jgi:hypothetical protein
LIWLYVFCSKLQETLLNLLLRNYLHYNLYDQAEKLRSKAPRFEAHSNQQVIHLLIPFIVIQPFDLLYVLDVACVCTVCKYSAKIPLVVYCWWFKYEIFLQQIVFVGKISKQTLTNNSFRCSSADTCSTWVKLGQFSWSTLMLKKASCKLLGRHPQQLVVFVFSATNGLSSWGYFLERFRRELFSCRKEWRKLWRLILSSQM